MIFKGDSLTEWWEENNQNMPFKIFNIVNQKRGNIIFWCVFIILFSNMGIIFSLFDAINTGEDIQKIFTDTMNTGAFYLNGISLLASYLGSIFIDFLNEKRQTKFITMKIIGIALSTTSIVFMSANYLSIYKAKELNQNSYWLQIALYVLAVVIGLYIFCISCMENKDIYNEYREYNEETEYNEDDDNSRDEIKKSSDEEALKEDDILGGAKI